MRLKRDARQVVFASVLLGVFALTLPTDVAGAPVRAPRATSVCARTEAKNASRVPCGVAAAGYRLVKDWDFAHTLRSEAELRHEFFTRYLYANGKLDHLNDEWSRFRDDQNHVFGPEGLALVARAAGVPAPGQVSSGMLRSKWTGKYGVYEARLKVPHGRGLWPAFWLNPQDGKWPPEIDIMEIVNNGRDTTQHSFHFLRGKAAKGAHEASSLLNVRHAFAPGLDYADDFHVFAVEWSEQGVRHLVDGKVIVERAYRWLHDDGSEASDAHVLLNLSVGGKWPGPPAEGVLPARLLVDYVRVWQR